MGIGAVGSMYKHSRDGEMAVVAKGSETLTESEAQEQISRGITMDIKTERKLETHHKRPNRDFEDTGKGQVGPQKLIQALHLLKTAI